MGAETDFLTIESLISLDQLENFIKKPELHQTSTMDEKQKTMKLESIYEWLAENKPKGRKKDKNNEGSNKQTTSEIEFKIVEEREKKEKEHQSDEDEDEDDKKEVKNKKAGEEEWHDKSEGQTKRRKVEKNKLNKFIQKKRKKI